MAVPEKPSVTPAVLQAAVSLVPVVGSAFAVGLAYASDLDKWRAGQTAEVARAECDDDDDERIQHRLLADGRLVDLLVVAIESARRTDWEAKRIAMGRVLGQALHDDADVDNHAALLTALSNLEPQHFALLARAEDPTTINPIQGLIFPEPYHSQLVGWGTVQWGLAGGDPTGGGGQRIWGLSPFGKRLLNWIRDAEVHADEG